MISYLKNWNHFWANKKKEMWNDVFSDTLPACEDKMLKTVDVGTGPGFFPIVLGQMGYLCIGAGLYVSHPVK